MDIKKFCMVDACVCVCVCGVRVCVTWNTSFNWNKKHLENEWCYAKWLKCVMLNYDRNACVWIPTSTLRRQVQNIHTHHHPKHCTTNIFSASLINLPEKENNFRMLIVCRFRSRKRNQKLLIIITNVTNGFSCTAISTMRCHAKELIPFFKFIFPLFFLCFVIVWYIVFVQLKLERNKKKIIFPIIPWIVLCLAKKIDMLIARSTKLLIKLQCIYLTIHFLDEFSFHLRFSLLLFNIRILTVGWFRYYFRIAIVLLVFQHFSYSFIRYHSNFTHKYCFANNCYANKMTT